MPGAVLDGLGELIRQAEMYCVGGHQRPDLARLQELAGWCSGLRTAGPDWKSLGVRRGLSYHEPLANCAAQGELEHQGGLRARRSRGGKTLNLAIWANAM